MIRSRRRRQSSSWIAVVLRCLDRLALEEVRKDMAVEVVWDNSEIPLKEEKQLLLHEIDLGKRE